MILINNLSNNIYSTYNVTNLYIHKHSLKCEIFTKFTHMHIKHNATLWNVQHIKL